MFHGSFVPMRSGGMDDYMGKTRVWLQPTVIAQNFILAVIAVIVSIPLVLTVQRSLAVNGFENYLIVLQDTMIVRNFLNSATVTVLTIILVTICVTLSAYAFSKLHFPLKGTIYLMFLLALMIPGASMLFPIFQVIRRVGLVDNFLGLVGPYAAFQIPFNLVIMKNYYDTIPNEILESAQMDGCNSFQTLIHIMIKLSGPVLAVIILWTFIGVWNEFMYAFILINDLEMRTLTTLPMRFTGLYLNNYELVFTALVIIQMPLVLLFIFTQRSIQEGLVVGAIKG